MNKIAYISSHSGNFLLVLASFLTSAVSLQAAPPEQLNLEALHAYYKVTADVKEVRIDGYWMFQRAASQPPRRVSIALPEEAFAVNTEDANAVVENGRISKDLDTASRIDSIGFSFKLANSKGTTQFAIKPDYDLDVMVMHVSGTKSKLESEILKPDSYRAERSDYSGVYTAGNIQAGTPVNISITGLPRRTGLWLWAICVAGLILIVTAGFFTMQKNRKVNLSHP